MEIKLRDVAKRFNKEWVFRKIDLTVDHGSTTAITGPNGSGKSTLLQIISGSYLPSTGEVNYQHQDQQIRAEDIYKYLSLVAPSMSVPEDLTLVEFLSFHFQFKRLKSDYMLGDLPALFKLEYAKNKYIKNFSTGMKQRLKLGVAMYADSPLLLLDEPATNLDEKGFDWYMAEMKKIMSEKTIIVCSNRKDEYGYCSNFIDILSFKR
jgi:ABC-type multidrug transport system ATPase subunit